jgi:transposase
MTKKTPAKSNKKHTTDFKLEALKLADRVGATEAAEKLGIYPSQIYSWRTAINNKRTQGERESILATENARLKRQLAEQAEELEILKKAATYFAKHQK